MVSAFFVTDVRHAFVSVHILLEWEISRKSSGKAYFTAVLGVRIQPRTLWWISILFRTPCQPHSKSGGTHFLQKMSVCALQGTVTHASNPPPTPPHTYSDNTATAGATVSNEQLMALFEKPATAKRFVDTCYSSLFLNGRLGTSKILCPSRYLLEQSNIRRSLLRAALTPPAQQSPSRTRRSPKGGGAATNGRHRRHLADAGHGHAMIDFLVISEFVKI